MFTHKLYKHSKGMFEFGINASWHEDVKFIAITLVKWGVWLQWTRRNNSPIRNG